jgi:hypothetical protein
MIVKPLEEFESARWRKYQKDITELVAEFEGWAKHLQEKYLAGLSEKEKAENMHRITDDGSFLISFNIEKLLGKQ